MKSHEFEVCDADPCVYRRKNDDGELLMAVHVDDFTSACTSEACWAKFVAEFKADFKARDEGEPQQVLGGLVTYGDGTITWSHAALMIEKLIETAQKYSATKLYTKNTPGVKNKYLRAPDGPVSPEEQREVDKFPFREINGSLCYLAMTTRPDIAFEVSQTAKFNASPGKEAIDAILQIVQYLATTRRHLGPGQVDG